MREWQQLAPPSPPAPPHVLVPAIPFVLPAPIQPVVKQQTLQEWVSAIPPVVGDVSARDVRRQLWYLTHRLGEAMEHFGSEQQRKHRWRCYIQRQRAMHSTMRALIGRKQPERVVVAWGNGSSGRGSCISRGWSFPQLEFHNYLRSRGVDVRVVDEFRTSNE